MRGKWNHKEPSVHQDEPADNTGPYVWRQTRLWAAAERAGRGNPAFLIHPETAMEIAAWFHGPMASQEAITAFSHSGTITEGLAEEIESEIGVQLREDNKLALRALLAYVKECTIQPWAVGKNSPGFTPNTPPSVYLDYADAVAALDGLLDDVPADVTGSDECDCPEDGAGESCTGCVMESIVNQDKAEHLPPVIRGKVLREHKPLEFTYTGPDEPTSAMVYFVQPGQEITYGDYLKQRDGE